MVGMMGGRQQLQTLLEEAARDPEILAIEVLNEEGKVLGSTQRTRVGAIADDPSLRQVLGSGQLLASHTEGDFRLLTPFRPSTIDAESARHMQEMMWRMMGRAAEEFLPPMNLAIRVDLSMARVEAAWREEMGKAIFTALICFSGGAAALYFILLAQDYRSVKRALQEMWTYTQRVVESMADGLLSVDVQGRITTVNPRARQLLPCQQRNWRDGRLSTSSEGHRWRSSPCSPVDCRSKSARSNGCCLTARWCRSQSASAP
jgi:PAS domain-containing protein